MPHAFGANIGGIDSVEAMRLRCVCDDHSGCWHIRNASGGAYKPGDRMMVWLYGGATYTATRAMWLLAKGVVPPADRLVFRACDSHDCVNPLHLRLGTRREAVRAAAKRGAYSSPKQKANARKAASCKRKATDELRVWLIESSQTGVDIAHAMGMSQGRVNLIRQQARARLGTASASVFAMGAAMGAQCDADAKVARIKAANGATMRRAA